MSATAATPEAAAQLLFPPNVQFNNPRLYTVKFLSSCFAGAVAGVLGLENTLGFALFIFSTLLTSSCLYVKCKGKPAKFVPGGWWEIVNPGQENVFSFVLVWTLFYGTHAVIPIFFYSRRMQTGTVVIALDTGIVHGTFAACDETIRQRSMKRCSQSTTESWPVGQTGKWTVCMSTARVFTVSPSFGVRSYLPTLAPGYRGKGQYTGERVSVWTRRER